MFDSEGATRHSKGPCKDSWALEIDSEILLHVKHACKHSEEE